MVSLDFLTQMTGAKLLLKKGLHFVSHSVLHHGQGHVGAHPISRHFSTRGHETGSVLRLVQRRVVRACLTEILQQ